MSRVGELIEVVPGMVATQHSGEGKANQYFLRGFNLDHGTDFAGFVDGVPVNLRTHGHGQGYLDFNFLIPELVERVEFRKGPYHADVGDFSAAGTAQIKTYDRLASPLLELVLGEYAHRRLLAAGSTHWAGGDLLLAAETTRADGPFVLDEDLRKNIAQLKFTRPYGDGTWRLGLSAYEARWTSTDQVPQRLIASGAISRYGFVDPDLGGETTRVALSSQYRDSRTEVDLYALHYDFALFSNFTYFLDDPLDGDEFAQRDRRQVIGGALARHWAQQLAGRPLQLRIGGDVRYDDIGRVGLYRSAARRTRATVREDAVRELSAGLYADAQLRWSERLRLSLGLRADRYAYEVDADLAVNGGRDSDGIVTPKLALAYRLAPTLELYANYGESFHSNDVRGATIRVDPVSLDAVDAVDVLARARGAELGLRQEGARHNLSLIGFWLDLDSELLFVGDAGTTEARAASRRHGAELSAFWQPLRILSLDLSGAWTDAAFRHAPRTAREIPGAVDTVVAAGATLVLADGWSTALRLRHFGSAPLIEDGSVESESTTVINLGLAYEALHWRVAFDALNLFDSTDADISYFFASRLPGEAAEGVEDLHLHPVEPRQLRLSLRYRF